jgi:surfactin synthase thioesterase subunit
MGGEKNKRINLFCLHFAGGNKYSYRQYIERAPSFLNIVALESPGRGARMKEPLISDIHALVNDLYKQICDKVDEAPYAIYGHSMGGLVAYLLAVKLKEDNHNLPLHLFITGTTGPSAPSRIERKRHLLDHKDFIQEIKELGGMPDEILQNEELLHYFEPILRSDFMVSENYVYEDYAPLNIPFTVITGTEEDMEGEDIYLWQKESTCAIDFKKLPGNHFFIYKYVQEIVDIIAKKLYTHTKVYSI